MELNYKVFGEGYPVVILHGMFGTLDNWQFIAKKLSSQFMVFILDLRNHGRSPHSKEFNYTLMMEDVRAFMEDNWIHHAYIVGHSMGGKVAMQLASEYPDMVEKLCVVDIAPKSYQGNHQAIFDALFALDLSSLQNRTEAYEFLKPRLKSESIVQFILKNISINKDTQQYEWKMNLPVIYEAYEHILGESNLTLPFDNPTLFIKGENSDYILEQEFESYKTLFPNATLVSIAEAGHWVHSEQTKKFLEHLESFLLK